MKKKVDINQLKCIMHNALKLRGIDSNIAEFMINDYIEAELCEQSSHGLSKFLLLDVALKNRQGNVEIVKQCGNYAKVDGHKELGHVAALFCIDKVIELAKEHGNSFVALKNASRYSRVKPFARKIAENGYIGIVLNNGGPSAVAPYGGTTPIFGTNPICYSFPSDKNNPYVFDFSTSKKVWAEIRQAILEKRSLPEDSFYDSEGNLTVDPKKADAVKVFGDYKGYALCYAVEILTGAFIDAKMGRKVNDEYDLGFLFIALSPEMFGDLCLFTKSVDDLANEVRTARPIKGNERIYVPGDLSKERFIKNNKNNSVLIDEDIYNRLKIMEMSLSGGIESNNKLN